MEIIRPLKAYRERRNLTLKEIAEEWDVSDACVSRWETGQRRISERHLLKISAKTGIPPEQLRPDLAKVFKAPRARRAA